MNGNMKKILLFVTVCALAIVAGSVWTSREVGFPDLEINVQFKVSVKGDGDERKES